jgi:acyl-CoA thioesterase-1
MVSVMRSVLWPGPFGYGARRTARNLLAAIVITASPAAADVTIAALGDSLTQGYGLPPDDGFVPQLQRWLDAQGAGEATILNAGVSGDTTQGGLSRVDWTLTPEVDALIVALGGNDLLRGIDPAVARANLAGIMQAAQAREIPVLLVGMTAPGNYGADYKAAFDAIYPDLAQRYGALLHPDFLGALAAEPDRAAALAAYMQPDGLHPSAAGVALIVEDIGPSVLDLVTQAADRGAP